MRGTLFKAKSKDDGKWVKGYYVKLNWAADDLHVIIPENTEMYSGNIIDIIIEIDPDTICTVENDGWIPVTERFPEKNEYFVDTSSNKDFPNGYYRRLEIAYMTDTIEYVHGYYDGYKWMDKYISAIKNVVAWRIHDPYQPKTITQRPEWKDRMLHTFLGGHK